MKLLNLIILLFTIFFVTACRKDDLRNNAVKPEVSVENSSVTLESAQTWFASKKSMQNRFDDNEGIDLVSLTPNWFSARYINYMSTYSLLVVPIKDSLQNIFPHGVYNLVFFEDSINNINARLLVFIPTENYFQTHLSSFNVNNFTGTTLQINEDGNVGEFAIIQNGLLTHEIIMSDSLGQEARPRDPTSRCPRLGATWFEKIIDNAGDFFDGFFGAIDDFFGSGEGEPLDFVPMVPGFWGSFFINPNGPYGQYGTSNNLNAFFDNGIFHNSQLPLQISECSEFDPADMPLIYATFENRHNWDQQFISAINFFLTQNNQGNSISFNEALQRNYTGFVAGPVDANQTTFHALAFVFNKMITNYNDCNNSSNNNGNINLGGEELCQCLTGYSTEDALKDFVKKCFDLTDIQATSVSSNETLLNEAFSILSDYSYSPEIATSVSTMLGVTADGWLYGPYPPGQRDAIIQKYDFIDPALYTQYILNFILLKKDHPTWSDFRIGSVALWETVGGVLHTSLDICGLIPVGGEPCDLINGVLYTIEGDGANAALSFAGTIPILGWTATGAKYASILLNTPLGIKTLTSTLENGIILFGSRTDLRTILNITDPLAQAHHVVPWGKQGHDLVQLAAKCDDVPFHMNHLKNGVEAKTFRFDLPDGIHANHPQYDAKIQSRLDDILDQLTFQYGGVNNIPVKKASEKLRELQDEIRNLILNNPTVKINDLIF